MSAEDTIFALASGSGMAAIAVVRLSGPATFNAVCLLAGSCPPPREYRLLTIRDPLSGEALDRCIVVWLPGPRSYTGEDAAELFLHASRAVTSAVLQALGAVPGCRLAEPGEFTWRAVLNGKMDLVEAEGLGDLLAADTALQRRQAFGLMSGQASSIFERWRRRLIHIRSNIEAVLDFADERGVAEEALPQIDADIQSLVAEMQVELTRSSIAKTIRDGLKVVLAGLPNTGKSSLLNALAGREAAIVSAIPGTTRDVIEVRMEIAGLPVLLVDTAGLRESHDVIEKEGVRRSREQIVGADLVVWVSSVDVVGSDLVPPGLEPDFRVVGKSDLPGQSHHGEECIALSAHTGAGLNTLISELAELIRSKFGAQEAAIVVSARQRGCTEDSIRSLNESLSVRPEALELKAVHIQRAADHIGRVTGRVDVEDWLGEIFSRFCIGK